MEKKFVKVQQEQITLYMVKLNVEELTNKTTVEYYNSLTDEGYQRPLVPSHYRKIAKYLQESTYPILPTAILTAVNPDQVEVIDENFLNIKGDLRVVDGQHRIEGMRYLEKINFDAFQKLYDYSFPVLIMVVPPEKKIYEINAFININKTSKPVSTDLAIQLKDKIRGADINLILDNLNESIATKVSQRLNNTKGSVWYELIKVGDHNTKGRTISINAFHQSLFLLINNYLKYNNIKFGDPDQFKDVVEDLTYIVSRAWEVIYAKWTDCFKLKKDNSDKGYNIQKGIGVYPLHQILGESVTEQNYTSDEIINVFQRTIRNSDVQVIDWKVGGNFSIYNSKSGFGKIAEYIKNNKEALS